MQNWCKTIIFFQLLFEKSADLTSFFADTNSYLTSGLDRVQTM